MRTLLAAATVVLTALGLGSRGFATPPEPTPAQIKAAVARSLPLLARGAAGYTTHRPCFSCHHQAAPVLALSTARARGFDVSAKDVERQVQFTAASLAKNRENYLKGRGQGGQATTAAYALLTLEAGGWKADATTAAVVEYLLVQDKELDYWRVSAQRPPSEATPFTSTYVAVRGLRKFGSPEQQQRIDERVARARRWLLATPAKDTEERVFRLGALKFAGAEDKEVRAAAQQLLQGQRKDGGWGQTEKLESDAYATGSALVALHQVGGLAVSDPVYQRGLKFLVATQQADGSWLVRSRSRPFQTYFESGFPHGKDQFISIAGSSWATTALILACESVPEKSGTAKKTD